jgi:predicted nucleic acid-binding protein
MIFVDSSFFIAQAVPRDRRHATAAVLARARSTERLLTSSLVLAESWTFFRRRIGHRFAMTWLDAARSAGNLGVERVDEELESQAWAWLRVHDERRYSFVDATSFALMRRRRITDALAFDGDFTAAGFVELRPS